MAIYTQRVQTVLTDEQFEKLSRISVESAKPMSVLVREAIEAVYFEQQQRQLRLTALEKLLRLNAPVGEWPDMEEEIIHGALE